jgi:alkylhydroperoxidase family enzyme
VKLAEVAGFQEPLFAVLQFTDYSTLRVEVPDAVFERVRKAGFEEREIVELVATVGGYNCVSRFLVALDVNERNGRDGMRESNKLVHEGLLGMEPARRPDGL